MKNSRMVFLDRDGVINREPGEALYVTSWAKFKFLPRAKKAISELYKNNFRIFVISNQAGVGKGLYSRKTLNFITKKMFSEIKKSGGQIEDAYYCIHRKEENCSCRKPKAGLIEKAKKDYSLKVKGSFFIGDTINDVDTARAAGVKSILVLSGKEKMANRMTWKSKPDFIFPDLFAAVQFILKT